MKQKRFLVARIDRIGDVVLSTPIPRELKREFPDCFVAVLVREYTKDIYLNNPNVDEIIIYNDGKIWKSFFSNLKLIRSFRFTDAFMLLPQENLSWLLFLAGIPNRIGVGHKIYQILTLTKFVNRRKYNPLRHEADYCLDMIRKIGAEPKSIYPEIHLSINESEIAESFKSEFTKGKLLIGVNSTSGNSAPNMLPTEYRKLIQSLLKIKEARIAVLDYEVPDEIKNLDKVIYLNENKRLRESIINFSMLDLLVSSSTGPMHIASALKVPTLSLFCPLTACSPKLWAPLGNKSEILMPEDEYCQNKCPGDPKKCNYIGAGGIDAEKVERAVINFLDKIKD